MTVPLLFFTIRKFGVKMEIKVLPLGDLGANCYLLKGEKGCIVIDPGDYSVVVENFLSENEDKERLILLTHCHFDHIGGAEELRNNTGVDIAIGADEAFALSDATVNLSGLFGNPLAPFDADVLLSDGQKLVVGDIELLCIKTAGHTVGGMCFLWENVLFSGDILFNRSIGRTDFPGGSFSQLEESVQRLYKLDGNITVYSGHGPATTIANERKNNPYVRAV